jgi:pantetheine-phosphate adenylyltransferase
MQIKQIHSLHTKEKGENTNMTKSIYAGTFDPFTIGHLNVLIEATCLFDKVIVAIADNPEKKRRIDSEIMFQAIQQTVLDLSCSDKIIVLKFHGLIIDLANNENTNYLIRGVRNGIDYDYEENLAKINESFELKTIYIRAGNLSHVSSSMVMELFKYGKEISSYVPKPVEEVIKSNVEIK